MSAQPAARSRWGARAIRPVSATIAIGGWASSETLPSTIGTDARAEAIPSWEAAVGTLMNCRSRL